MGLTRLIIKIGATGSTAKWVAKNYSKAAEENLSLTEVMAKLIEMRYRSFNPNGAKDKLIERLNYLDNLTDFTFSILQLEGAIRANSMTIPLQMEVTSVIIETLKKHGISDKLIAGKPI